MPCLRYLALPCFLLSLAATGLQAQPSREDLAREIADLKARVAELDKLKERLAALEKLLAAPAAPPPSAPAAPPAAPTPPAAPAPARPAAPPVRVGGYVQMRYEWNAARKPRSDLLLRRARLRILADPTPWATAFLQLEAATSTMEARCAFLDLKTRSGAFLRAGQFMIPFGVDMTDAPHERIIPEVAHALEVLFNGSLYDRGVFVARPARPDRHSPGLYVGLLNGSGINRRDNNGTKDLVARFVQPFRWGALGASAYTGNTTRTLDVGGQPTAVTTPKERFGAEAQALVGPLELRGEWVRGRDLGFGVDGGYLQGIYRFPRFPGLPFARYDWFDPNRRASGDRYSRWTLGYAHPLGPLTRLTFWQEIAKDPATRAGDNLASFQIQQRF